MNKKNKMLKFLVDDQSDNRLNDYLVVVRCDNEVRCMPSSSIEGTIDEEAEIVSSFGMDQKQVDRILSRPETHQNKSFRCCKHKWLVYNVPLQDMFTGKW